MASYKIDITGSAKTLIEQAKSAKSAIEDLQKFAKTEIVIPIKIDNSQLLNLAKSVNSINLGKAFGNNQGGKNVDKQSKNIDKTTITKGRDKTVTDTTYSNGKNIKTVNGVTTSEKEVINLKKEYGALNKEITEYYQLKTKVSKGNVKPEEYQQTKARMADLEKSILDRRKYLKEAKDRGFYNDEYENRSARIYRNAKSDYEMGVEARQQAKENQAEKNRLATQKAYHEAQKAEQEKWIADMDKSAKAEHDAYTKRQNSLMAAESTKLSSIREKAKALVTDEAITTSRAKRENRISNYSGQTSSDLTNAEDWSQKILDSQNRLKSLISTGASLGEIEREFNNLTAATKAFEASIGTVESTMEKSLNMSSLDKAREKIANFQKEYSEFMTKAQSESLTKIQGKYTDGLTSSGKESVDKELSAVMVEVKQRKEALTKLSSIRDKAESGEFSLRTTTMETELSKYTGQSSTHLEKLRSLAKQVNAYQTEITSALTAENIDTSHVSSLYENLEKSVTKYKNALQEVKQVESKTLGKGEAQKDANEFRAYMNSNTKAWSKYKDRMESIYQAKANAQTKGDQADAARQAKQLQAEIKSQGLTGSSTWADMKRAFGQIAQFTGMYYILQNTMMQFPSKVVSAVREVNAAQIELRKVSNASDTELKNYWDEATASAQKYGATVSDVISSTADWSKLGYNLEDAKKLSDATTLYQRVGDNMTQETASQSLVSTLQGYNMQASQAESIVDKLNEVANNFAIGSDGIGDALQRSAASFNASHTSLSKSIALITGTNTTLQDPDKVGNMWKTVSARLRGSESELSEMNEDTDGLITSTSKLQAKVKALTGGFDIMQDKDTYKDIYDIVVGIGERWSSLSDINRADLLETLAGKNQSNALAAAINNVDVIKSAYETAENSSGSAEKELENYKKGIEYSIEQIKGTFQDFSTSFLGSDLFKTAVEGANEFLKVLTQIVDTFGGIPAIIGTISAVASLKSKGGGKRHSF